MAVERPSDPLFLTAIRVDFKEQSITIEADQTATKLTITPEGVRYELLGFAPAITERSVDQLSEEATEKGEKASAVTLSGRLKTKPREGRPDAKGQPTAWARFMVHDEENDSIRMLSATFHRGTARTALMLERDDRLTAQGYLHPADRDDRLDTFSIFRLVNYPDKSGDARG